MVLADELEADWSRVRLQESISSDKYGSQDTDGSCSIRDFYETMREGGATTRMVLHNHEVVHQKSGRKLGYGGLAAAAAKQPLPHNTTIQLKKTEEFR